ncbi:MAG: Crp/Fnr family transcriptional regulator [Bacteroidia bacterium]
MIEYFIQTIANIIELSEADKLVIRENSLIKRLKKRQFFLQEGDVCRYAGFVTKGCLKTYSTDKNGDEHVFQFALEGWWASDMYSHLTGEPATYNIEAIEDSELVTMDLESRDKVLQLVPKYERFMRILLEKNYVASQRRVNSMLGSSAEERYLSFIKTYPQIVQRVPQHSIASYLGIAPESLSRIRKQMAK